MNVGNGRRLFTLLGVKLDPVQFEHLDLQTLGQSVAERLRVAPSEYSGIATRFHMTPLDVQQEVLVLLLAAHHSDGLAFADKDAVLDVPSVRRSIDVDPTSQILPVEQVDPLGYLGSGSLEGQTDSR